VVEHGGFRYDADYYGDDLPFWQQVEIQDTVQDEPQDTHGQPRSQAHLIVPYTLDTNDMRFAAAQGFNSGTQFYDYLKDAFDVLYAEGDPSGLNQPKMLSIGLHCRLVGRPARIAALARFLDYVQAHQGVWITRRIDIAEHWHLHHPPPASPLSPR
jgi:peptidoglycan/xylan/chitin deacetylase (PgdA/CDA1 family)